MHHHEPRRWRARLLPGLAALVALLCLTTLAVLAQNGTFNYNLTWHTVNAGGATFSVGGRYSLGGTAGQPAPGAMSGGVFSLAGGFWPGAAAASPTPPRRLFLPLVVKNRQLTASSDWRNFSSPLAFLTPRQLDVAHLLAQGSCIGRARPNQRWRGGDASPTGQACP